jgi:hypothetical protein
VSRRKANLLIAAVWACAIAAGVLLWFVPASARFVGSRQWPLGVATGFTWGWVLFGRKP